MVAPAPARFSDPQINAAILRENKLTKQRQNFTGAALPDLSNRAITENLPSEQQFAEANRRYRLARSTFRDSLPDLSQIQSEADADNALAVLQEEEFLIAQEAQNREIDELEGLRQEELIVRAQMEELLQAKRKAKQQQEMLRLAVQAGEEIGGDIVEVAEMSFAEADGGVGSIISLTKTAGRVGVSALENILFPSTGENDPTPDSKAGVVVKSVLPPYRFIFGGAKMFDLLDDGNLAATLFVPGLFVVFLGTIISVILVMIFGIIGGSLVLAGSASAVGQSIGSAITSQ